MGKLTARQVETLKEPGRHSDGGNLYLNITKAGAKSWVFFYRFDKVQREMGLGGIATTSLAQARVKALAALKLLKDGIDPLAERRAAEKIEASKISFGAFADEYVKTHEGKFRNDKHKAQWASTLGPAYCGAMRSLPLNAIDTQAVLKVLRPLWQKVPETASRLRGRIENILDSAKAQGYRDGLENPARWKGHLKSILPARQRLTRGHHVALAYDDLPAFISALRGSQATAALALELCILTATRSGEVLNSNWNEFDLTKAVWTIPANRMKAGHEHRVPLTPRAVEILDLIQQAKHMHNDYVFAGNAKGKPLSNMAMAVNKH